MDGNLILNEGDTEESIIDEFFNHPKHSIYLIDDDASGYLCTTEYDDYVIVNFAWHVKTFESSKKMVKLGKALYTVYTKGNGLPMFYSGKTNHYPNHSIIIDNNVWQFIA